jgi:hypothetical protein
VPIALLQRERQRSIEYTQRLSDSSGCAKRYGQRVEHLGRAVCRQLRSATREAQRAFRVTQARRRSGGELVSKVVQDIDSVRLKLQGLLQRFHCSHLLTSGRPNAAERDEDLDDLWIFGVRTNEHLECLIELSGIHQRKAEVGSRLRQGGIDRKCKPVVAVCLFRSSGRKERLCKEAVKPAATAFGLERQSKLELPRGFLVLSFGEKRMPDSGVELELRSWTPRELARASKCVARSPRVSE